MNKLCEFTLSEKQYEMIKDTARKIGKTPKQVIQYITTEAFKISLDNYIKKELGGFKK